MRPLPFQSPYWAANRPVYDSRSLPVIDSWPAQKVESYLSRMLDSEQATSLNDNQYDNTLEVDAANENQNMPGDEAIDAAPNELMSAGVLRPSRAAKRRDLQNI